jgi:hypothetical protein
MEKDWQMHKTLKIAAIALALTGTAFVSVNMASAADVAVSFNTGDVAFGYNDGYWDHGHTWHAWQQPAHRDAYKSAKDSQYHDWKHDRDPDKGWHESK